MIVMLLTNDLVGVSEEEILSGRAVTDARLSHYHNSPKIDEASHQAIEAARDANLDDFVLVDVRIDEAGLTDYLEELPCS